jgi:hypothetical protein
MQNIGEQAGKDRPGVGEQKIRAQLPLSMIRAAGLKVKRDLAQIGSGERRRGLREPKKKA